MTPQESQPQKVIETFLPELSKLRRAKQKTQLKVYSGPLGRIGATPRSRYRLVAISALLTLLALMLAASLSIGLTALVSSVAALLIALGWPAATGVAELRGRRRITSHSLTILAVGLASVLSAWLQAHRSPLELLPAIASVGVVAAFMVELARGEGALGRLESVISTVSGVMAAVSLAGWVGLAALAQEAESNLPVIAIGTILGVALALMGTRLIYAGPREGPRRGALTLGVTPVAFIGVVSYVSATFLTRVIG